MNNYVNINKNHFILLFIAQKVYTTPATIVREEFLCPTNFGNGNYADPATCRRFYQASTFEDNIYVYIALNACNINPIK